MFSKAIKLSNGDVLYTADLGESFVVSYHNGKDVRSTTFSKEEVRALLLILKSADESHVLDEKTKWERLSETGAIDGQAIASFDEQKRGKE